jgi:hypothetical protein
VPPPAPRSLADDLRARDDEQLAMLVQARPDLVHPVPADLAALAQRAGSPASVAAALRGYDELVLHVVLVAAMAPDPIRPADLVRAVAAAVPSTAPDGMPPREAQALIRTIVDRLRTEALLWGTDRALHLVGPARDLLVPADRGPRLAALDAVVAGYARDPLSLRAVLATAPTGARAALDRLLAGPVIGTVVDARRTPDPGRSPVDWLLAHHLLVPMGTDRAVLPAEVVTILRAIPDTAPVLPVAQLVPPGPQAPATDPDRADAGAVGAVLDVLHAVAELGQLWADAPPSRLRTGGISQRDMVRTARELGVPDRTAALIVDLAAAAGLLGPDAREVVTMLPTPAFDAWIADPPASRHAALIAAWRDMPRMTAEADQRPLGPELAVPHLPALRREVLAALVSAPGGWTDDEVLEVLRWRTPRRDEPDRPDRVLSVLADLRTLGLLVAGTLTTPGRALLATDAAEARSTAEAALARCLPAQVDTLIMQADLSAIVPGLPGADLAALMRLVAEPESAGAASVYRFTPRSVRAALDSGRTSADLLAELRRRGTVPQPLAYLIEDVARRHAALRIGSAATFLRCDDPVVLAAILADPGAAGLGLFRLADTVLASEQPPEHVLDQLRRLGHHPQPEPGRGPASPQPRRARARAAANEPTAGPVTSALARAAVRAMRANDPGAPAGRAAAGDRGNGPRGLPPGAAGRGPHPVPTSGQADVLAALRAAIAADAPVWIGYADPTGVAGDRRVEPLRLSGGYLTALDLRTEEIQSFALARITGVQVQ